MSDPLVRALDAWEEEVIGQEIAAKAREARAQLVGSALSRIEILNQDQWWIDREGMRVPVERIDSRYALNIVNFLRRQAIAMKEMEEEAIMLDPLLEDMNEDNSFPIYHEIGRQMGESPVEWLSQKPLIRALMKKIHPDKEP